MSFSYRIEPGRLSGQVRVSGAKNSALRLLAGSLLTSEPLHLSNYPSSLRDAQVHVGMLGALGKQCEVSENEILITERTTPPQSLEWEGRSIRNNLLIWGALIARTGAGRVPLPGGCQLGERKFDLHEMVLRELGAHVWVEDNALCGEAVGRLRGADIHLPIRSTGATENAILCGSLAEGTTRIWNPHIRPEILDLIQMLRGMGARIEVRGQERIDVEGSMALGGTSHRTLPDNMEAITWLIGAAVTGGDVEIVDFPFEHLEVPLIFLRESGVRLYRGTDRVIVRGGEPFPVEISTGPYPGINSDMQPLFALFGACAQGESRIIDLRFPDRYGYAEELAKMGVRYEVRDNLLRIHGGTPLVGANVRAVDLRAGAALALAALVADGPTTIHDAWQIERGYQNFPDKLRSLGGSIEVDQAAVTAVA